jgi:hypothetical protein
MADVDGETNFGRGNKTLRQQPSNGKSTGVMVNSRLHRLRSENVTAKSTIVFSRPRPSVSSTQERKLVDTTHRKSSEKFEISLPLQNFPQLQKSAGWTGQTPSPSCELITSGSEGVDIVVS